jgi:hypothetical protein
MLVLPQVRAGPNLREVHAEPYGWRQRGDYQQGMHVAIALGSCYEPFRGMEIVGCRRAITLLHGHV